MMNKDVSQRISCKEALSNKWLEKAGERHLDQDKVQLSLNNLATFNAKQKLQQATMAMMVHTMVSKEEMSTLTHIF